jgi:hypothetical protein
MMFIFLFHGRKTIGENLESRGEDGPTFEVGGKGYVHTTYASEMKWVTPTGIYAVLSINTTEGLAYYDGMWYGDWSVYGPTARPLKIDEFDEDKATFWMPPRRLSCHVQINHPKYGVEVFHDVEQAQAEIRACGGDFASTVLRLRAGYVFDEDGEEVGHVRTLGLGDLH